MKITAYTLAFLLTVMSVQAQQRPLQTEDVETTPSGSLELSLGMEFQQDAKFPLSGLAGNLTRAGVVRLKSGVGKNVEITFDGSIQNYLSIRSRTTPSPIPLTISGNATNDWDDFTVAVKVRMRNESKRFPAIATKFGYQMPNTDQARGIGTNQVNIFSKVILQKNFGGDTAAGPRTKLFGNVGLGIMSSPLGNFGQNDLFLYGLAGIVRLSDRVNLATEVNGRVNTRTGGAPLGTESVGQYRLGTQIKAGSVRFDAAGLVGLTAKSPRSGFLFGITYVTRRIFPEVE